MHKTSNRLKHFLLILVTVLLLLPTATMAQEKEAVSNPGDLRGGIGVLSAPLIATAIGKAIIGSLAGYTRGDIKSGGAFSLSYLLPSKSNLSFGVDLVYQATETTYETSGGVQKAGDDTWFTVMPRLDYRYINKPNFQLYSNLSAGITMLTSKLDGEKDSGSAFGFHISPLGIRAGDKVAFFGELGFGFRGLLHAGLAVKL